MDSNVMKTADTTTKIIQLHQSIQDSLRRTVGDAVEIGRLLGEEQAKNTRSFLSWMAKELPFSQKTAYRYMVLFKHKAKVVTMTSLQEAYRLIGNLDSRAKKIKDERAQEKVEEANRTGFKPENWDDDAEFEFRKRQVFESEKPIPNKDDAEESSEDFTHDEIHQLFERIMAESSEEASLDLSDVRNNVKQKGIFAVIEEYVQTFPTASDQLEAIHNLIKKLRLIAVEIHTK